MESFAELFEKSIETAELKPGSIIKAEVVQINKDFVVLNAGLKSEGFIPAAQFTDENGNLTVNVGDTVEVALEALEDGFGETKISHEKAQRIRTWEVLEQKFNDSETITGVISGRVKGGFTVDVEGVKAFLPGSLVDVRPVKDPALSEGKEIDFKIIKLDQKRNNIVISRRAVLENEYKAERDEVLKNLQEEFATFKRESALRIAESEIRAGLSGRGLSNLQGFFDGLGAASFLNDAGDFDKDKFESMLSTLAESVKPQTANGIPSLSGAPASEGSSKNSFASGAAAFRAKQKK